jgi:hypothetical protein
MLSKQCIVQIPIGVVWQFPLWAELPPGFLRCDGAEHLRIEYPDLFAAIRANCGEGDGRTTFRVPNAPDSPGMYYGIKAGPSANEQVQQLYFMDLARRLRDPEQYADACDEAADAVLVLSRWVVGDFCTGTCGGASK